jgi:hypothetical protein
MVFVTYITWQKTADFEVGWRNIKFTSVVIIMNKEMILYSYLYSYCVGPAAGRRTHTHTYTLSSLYRRFNTTLIIDLNISLATVYFILVLFVNRLQKLLEMPEHVRPQDVVTEGETLFLKFVCLLFFDLNIYQKLMIIIDNSERGS